MDGITNEINNMVVCSLKKMNIKQQENLLFEEWKKKQGYSYFISDGVFDEAEWNKQDYKILFVLKEANWKNGNADLCKYLLSEPKSSYWKTCRNGKSLFCNIITFT